MFRYRVLSFKYGECYCLGTECYRLGTECYCLSTECVRYRVLV